MSEHIWCQENIAAFVAGGLELSEAAQLEKHLAECADCAGSVEQAWALERKLAPLFLDARPGPALEDRLIRALPSRQARRRLLSLSGKAKTCLALAAAVLVIALGAAVTEVVDPDTPTQTPRMRTKASLPEGYRAVGQQVNLGSTAAGFASLPNSRVDLILTQGKGKNSVSEILLENVLVLDADNQNLRDENGKVMPAKVVTFALKAEDAAKLDQARQSGSISLALRKSGETARVGDLRTTEERALNSKSANELAKEMREQTIAALKEVEKADAEGWADRSAWSARPLKLPIAEPPAVAEIGGKANKDKLKDAKGKLDREEKKNGKSEPEKRPSPLLMDYSAKSLLELEKVLRDQKQVQAQTDRGKAEPAELKEAMDKIAKVIDRATPGTQPAPTQFGPNSFIAPKTAWALPSDDKKLGGMGMGDMPGMGMMGSMGTYSMQPSQKLGEPKGGESKKKEELAFNQSKDKADKFPRDFFMQPGEKLAEELDKDKAPRVNLIVPSPSLPTSPPVFDPVAMPPPPPAKTPGPSSGLPAPTTELPPALVPSASPMPVAPDSTASKAKATEPAEPAQKPPTEKPKTPETKIDPPQQAPRKIIIRTGELEFEVDSFDASVVTIMKLINNAKGGFVATINSEKLPNGKVRGSVVIRIPPELLDGFVLDLRKDLGKIGELKNQRIGSQDITKQYTDLESRLRAARTMEDRLLNIIKDGKGQIKDLLLAEKELGVWRTQIEEIEGELRYYGNLASLSTLTIKLYEKDIRSASIITENERVQAGLEVEDVDKVRKEVLKAIKDVKGRVIRDELKQQSAGQFNATMHFEVSPEATGPTRDRLKQLGNLVRLQIDRLQTTEDGSPPAKNGKIEYGNTQFQLSIYNLANVTPRESNVLRLAVSDVPGTYQKLRDVIAKAKGHVANAQLNEQDKQKINAQLDFNVLRAAEAEILTALAGTGETLSRQVVRFPEGDNVTDSKVAFSISLVDADFIQPRETVTVRIATADVKSAYDKLREALGKTKSKTRILTDQLNDQDKRNITAQLDFTYSRSDEVALQKALTQAGETLARQVTRLPESNNVTDAKVLIRLELFSSDTIQPRETLNIRIAADDLRGSFEKLRSALLAAKARVINAEVIEKDQQLTAQLEFTYVRPDEAVIQTALTGAGETLGRLVTRLPESPAVTDAKVLVRVELLPTDALQPREKIDVTIAVADVSAAYDALAALVAKVKGRTLIANSNKDDRGSALLAFTFARGNEAIVQTALAAAGQTLTKKVERILEPGNYTDTKVLAVIKLEQSDSLKARETVKVKIAAADVPAAYLAIKAAIARAKGRISNANLNEKDRSNISAELSFDVPRTAEDTLQAQLAKLGETLSRQATREPESIKLTDTKIGFELDFVQADSLRARETVKVKIAAVDVPAAYQALKAAIAKAKGRISNANLDEKDRSNITGKLSFDVPRAEEADLQTQLTNLGETLSRESAREPESVAVTDTKIGFDLDITSAASILPRETITLLLESSDVAATMANFAVLVKEAQGRVIEPQIGKERDGKVTARAVFDVPFQSASSLVEKFRTLVGQDKVLIHKVMPNPQAPEGKLALGRIFIGIESADLIVPSDQGVRSDLRRGMSVGVLILSKMLSWLIVGVLCALPLVVVAPIVTWVARRFMGGGKAVKPTVEAPHVP